MPIPDFEATGDLPPGLHPATIEEVIQRFGIQNERRASLANVLQRVLDLSLATTMLARFVVFGSFITNKVEPNDVDVAMVMDDSFRFGDLDEVTAAVFDHQRAQLELGVSIFWIRPSHLFLGTVDSFLRDWQATRNKSLRGIVEIQV